MLQEIIYLDKNSAASSAWQEHLLSPDGLGVSVWAGGTDSAQNASPVTQPALDELDVFQVIFDYVNQKT